jgi:hypothetical protein
MIWIYTPRMIAVVADQKMGRGDRPIMKLIGNPMGKPTTALIPDPPIPTVRATANKLPASVLKNFGAFEQPLF